MKKFLSVLLMSALLVTTLSVFALADDNKYGIMATVDSDKSEDKRNEEVVMGTVTVYENSKQVKETSFDETGTNGGISTIGEAKANSIVDIVCNLGEGYVTDSVNAYYYENPDLPQDPEHRTNIVGNRTSDLGGNTWTFTMVPHQVFVDIRFELRRPPASPAKTPASNQGGDAELNPTAAPESEFTYIPSPAYNSNEEEAPAPQEPQEPQSASTVPTEAPKSVLPPNTVTFGSGSALASTGAAYNRVNNLTKNNAEKLSATVLSLKAKDLSNQNGLAAYYAAIEGKEADILATYGVYASKDLSAEDNGKLTSLTWKNITAEKLDKKTRIKAVCYNLIDGTYTIEGEIDEFGNVILKNFIIRPAQTNITVFICK